MTAIEHRPNLPALPASDVKPQSPFDTHRVENQPPALENYNAFTSDVALREAVSREGGAWGFDRLSRFGAVGGQSARSSPGAFKPIAIRPCSGRTTVSAGASTRSSFIRPGTS